MPQEAIPIQFGSKRIEEVAKLINDALIDREYVDHVPVVEPYDSGRLHAGGIVKGVVLIVEVPEQTEAQS